MNDYNFFDSSKVKKGENTKGGALRITGLVLTLIALGGVVGYTYYQNNTLQKEIDAINEILNKPENIENVARNDAKELLLISLQEMGQGLTDSTETIIRGDVINQNLFDVIVAALPVDAQLIDVSMSQDAISLNGVAAQRSAVAEFERTLRASGVFDTVSVSNIDTQEVNADNQVADTDVVVVNTEKEYTFNLNITLGGVDNEDN